MRLLEDFGWRRQVVSKRLSSVLGNLAGAFADGAVLFPLLVALSAVGGFSGAILLASAGAAYLFSAAIFQVPMSVQPLKSVAVTAIAVGASCVEVRIAAALLALFCLFVSILDVDRLAARVPSVIVHGLQLGLGVMLVLQGAAFDRGWITWALAGLMVLSPRLTRFPLLGIVATAGLVLAILEPTAGDIAVSPPAVGQDPRWPTVLSLAVPQLALTLANSVIGTRDAARRYFGPRAERVTHKALLRTIGLGNFASAAVGGLPFCHGAGGLTAHVRGGATHWIANLFVGTALLGLAAAQALGGSVALQFPAELLASLLVATGVFHLQLAGPTWNESGGKWKLVVAGTVALASRNLLWVLSALVAICVAEWLVRRARARLAIVASTTEDLRS